MARILYHFHALLGTATGTCTGSAHDPRCSFGPLTTANEVQCRKPANTPVGRPCRCEHKVPEPWIGAELPPELELWEGPVVRARAKSKRSKVAKK
jgi:hypothetical protein